MAPTRWASVAIRALLRLTSRSRNLSKSFTSFTARSLNELVVYGRFKLAHRACRIQGRGSSDFRRLDFVRDNHTHRPALHDLTMRSRRRAQRRQDRPRLSRPASRFSMISSASSSGSGRLSRSVRLLSLSQKMSRLVLSRASSSS